MQVEGTERKNPLTKHFPDMKVVSGIVIQGFITVNLEIFTISTSERFTIVN